MRRFVPSMHGKRKKSRNCRAPAERSQGHIACDHTHHIAFRVARGTTTKRPLATIPAAKTPPATPTSPATAQGSATAAGGALAAVFRLPPRGRASHPLRAPA
eukprot:683069-Prymnesium_polylepis.1